MQPSSFVMVPAFLLVALILVVFNALILRAACVLWGVVEPPIPAAMGIVFAAGLSGFVRRAGPAGPDRGRRRGERAAQGPVLGADATAHREGGDHRRGTRRPARLGQDRGGAGRIAGW